MHQEFHSHFVFLFFSCSMQVSSCSRKLSFTFADTHPLNYTYSDARCTNDFRTPFHCATSLVHAQLLTCGVGFLSAYVLITGFVCSHQSHPLLEPGKVTLHFIATSLVPAACIILHAIDSAVASFAIDELAFPAKYWSNSICLSLVQDPSSHNRMRRLGMNNC